MTTPSKENATINAAPTGGTGSRYARSAKRLAEGAAKAIQSGRCNAWLVLIAREAIGQAEALRAPSEDVQAARAALHRAEDALRACVRPRPTCDSRRSR